MKGSGMERRRESSKCKVQSAKFKVVPGAYAAALERLREAQSVFGFALFTLHFEICNLEVGGPHGNHGGSQADPLWLPQGDDYAGTKAADICCKAA